MKNIKKGIVAGLLAIVFVLTMVISPINVKATGGEKFVITGSADTSSTQFVVAFDILDGTNSTVDMYAFFPIAGITTEDQLRNSEVGAVLDWAHNNGYSGAVSSDVLMFAKPTLASVATTGSYSDLLNLPPTFSFNNTPSHSFVTTAAAANGFQVSSTRNALVNYAVTVSSAVQIGVVSNVTGYASLEIAATNSTTAGDWKEVSRVSTGQNIGLALALSSTQTVTGSLSAMVPAGYYARIRTTNSNGTPTYTYIGGQEVLL